MTWCAMDSAPRDGTRVLVRYEKCAGYFDVVEAYTTNGETWRMRGCCSRVIALGWQPLPSADLSAPSPIVEAEIRGMRTGFEIAREHLAPVYPHSELPDLQWDHSIEALDTAITALREGRGL